MITQTPPPAHRWDDFLLGFLARRGNIDRRAVAAAAPTAGGPLLDALVAVGVIDRVAARAVTLVVDGQLDERDLAQVVNLPAVRARLARLVATAEPPPAPDEPPLRLGGSFGRYPVKGLLGRGRTGHVYLSAHPDLRVPVALKVTAGGPAEAEKLRAEARALARVTHPNVVRVWDVEQAGELVAVVLQYADGESLAHALARDGVVAPAVAFRAARDLIRGLRAAHDAGVVHGDVKPANVLGTLAGRFLLADFGTARRASVVDGPAVIEGTWPYTAPEWFDGAGDHRSDIYSLGLTLYHLLTGAPPVTARGFLACRGAHRELTLDPLDWTVPGVGKPAADLIRRMTAADPDARPRNYTELVTAARRAFRSRPTT